MRKLLLLDSAIPEEVRFCLGSKAIAGVTSNPSLMAKKKKSNSALSGMVLYKAELVDLAQEIENQVTKYRDSFYMTKTHFSVEVVSTDPQQIKSQAEDLHNLFEGSKYIEVYVKIPVTLANLDVISSLSRNSRIKVNATACMTFFQAKMASDAGASIVSFFYNRMLDGKMSRPEAQKQIEDYVYLTKDRAKVICGSIRTPQDVLECWRAGADYVTAPFKIIEQMIKHPQTDLALDRFEKDLEAWLNGK